MATRREFLGTVAAATAVPMVAGAQDASAAIAGVAGEGPACVVVDTRFADSLVFGKALAAGGAARLDTAGDVATLWFERIEPRLAAAAPDFAGLTTQRTLLYLEQLARSHGYVTTLRIEHRLCGDATVSHDVSRCPGRLPANLFEGGAPWAEQAAALALAHPASGANQAGRRVVSRASSEGARDEALLVTWRMRARTKPGATARI